MNKTKNQKDFIFSDDLETAMEEIKKIAEAGTLGDKKMLTGLLDSDSPGIVESAQNAIVGIRSGKKQLIKKLMDTAVSSSFSIKSRSNSFDTLKRIAMKDGNFLAGYAGKNNGKYDRVVAEIIRYGNFTPKDYPKKVLILLSRSGDEITRANALESIGILKLKLGKILVKALNDSFFVLSAAVFSIGELKLKSAIPKLKEMLLNTGDRVVKNIVIESLSKIGGEEAIDFLLYLFNKKTKFKLDKIYLLKSLYKICGENDCGKKSGSGNISGDKEKLYFKISKMNLKISIYSLSDYEEKDAADSILCYFSLSNHKKSRKIFNFIFDYYQKNDNIDECQYGYIKNILKKIARPKYITDYIESLKPSSENNKIGMLIDVLSEISPKDIIKLLDYYGDKKFFIEIKLSLLKYSERLSAAPYEQGLAKIVMSRYIEESNGDVRKASVILLGRLGSGSLYAEKIFGRLLSENYPDVIDAYIESLSGILGGAKHNKKLLYFFIGNLSSKNIKAAAYSLRVLGYKKLDMTDEETAYLYSTLLNFKRVKSVALKRLLAKAVKNFDLIRHKEALSFLLEEEDEETKLNYLESLLMSGEKNHLLFFGLIRSRGLSDIFRYKIIELIQKSGGRECFGELVSVLGKEKSKMVKIGLLRALRSIDKEKAEPIIKKFSLSKDKDLRDFSLELIKTKF